MPFLWSIVTFLLFMFQGGLAFLVTVDVPSQAEFRGSVSLSCFFDLGGQNLYSLKWYKDEDEFFRYMPNYRPQIQIFPVDGVTLDGSQLGLNHVTLTDLTFNSSGTYSCEVSSEGPEFKTIIKGYKMEVIALPDRDPAIEGFQSIYSIGDMVEGNCTSAKSKPPALLTWRVNKGKAKQYQVRHYPVSEDEEGLKSATLGLRFMAEDIHFLNVERTLELTCTAFIEGHVRNSTFRANRPILSNQKFSADMMGNRGTIGLCNSTSLILCFIASLLACSCSIVAS